MNGTNGNGRPGRAEPGDGPGHVGNRPLPETAGQQEIEPQQDAAGVWAAKPGRIAAAGAAAASLPAAPGLALAAAGHPQTAVPLLIGSGLIGILTVITSAAVRGYESRQQTRRLEIQHAGTTAIAEAMARCIDDTHVIGQDVQPGDRAAEAARVRASAGQAVVNLMPAMLAAIEQQVPRTAELHDRASGHVTAQP